MNVTFNSINWALLREQKQWLLAQDNELANGLVNIIDEIQDQAVDNGYLSELEVFGINSNDVTQ